LIQGFEGLGDGVQGYTRKRGWVGWERLIVVMMSEYKLMFFRCLI